jgi:hypothetical protein
MRLTVSLTPEALYPQLGSLIAEMPDLAHGPITPAMNQWLGRAVALVEATGTDRRAATQWAMVLALVPPAFVLALGSALIWAFRGFR